MLRYATASTGPRPLATTRRLGSVIPISPSFSKGLRAFTIVTPTIEPSGP